MELVQSSLRNGFDADSKTIRARYDDLMYSCIIAKIGYRMSLKSHLAKSILWTMRRM